MREKRCRPDGRRVRLETALPVATDGGSESVADADQCAAARGLTAYPAYEPHSAPVSWMRNRRPSSA
jgi:hypothetical protein